MGFGNVYVVLGKASIKSHLPSKVRLGKYQPNQFYRQEDPPKRGVKKSQGKSLEGTGNKKEELGKSRNIKEVMLLWKEREKEGLDAKAVLEPPGRHIDTELLNEEELLTILNTDDDVDVDRPDVTLADLTGTESFEYIDRKGLEGSDTRNCSTPSENMTRLVSGLRRKRKNTDDEPDQNSPKPKRRNHTPLQGEGVKESGTKTNIQANQNLITNHFQFSSLAQQHGGDGHAVRGAVGVLGEGGAEGGGAVQDTRAKFELGLTGGAVGGKTKRVVTENRIGSGQTAGNNLTNTGQSTIQLLKEKLRRGNVRNSNSKK